MGINIGALASPWVVGFLRGHYGFHAGFAAAAIGMGLALVAYVGGRRVLGDVGAEPTNPIEDTERRQQGRLAAFVVGGVVLAMAAATVVNGGSFGLATMVDAISYICLVAPVVFFLVMYRSPKVDDTERRRLLAYIPLFLAAMLFFMLFEQASTTLTTFAADRTELRLFGHAIQPEFFQSVNPFAIIALTPLFAALWTRRGERSPRIAGKFAIGLALAGASFAVMALASQLTGSGKASPLWLVLVYVVQTLGELCLSPVGLAATTLLAPRAFRSQTMALWFLAPAAGQAITAQVVQATRGASDTAYFGGLAVVTLAFAAALTGVSGWVHRESGH
jgi:POT family proton-dependent oligopeptide transporter